MPDFIDQLGRTVRIDRPPARIISLVPSQSELLDTLGASVVGITRFCVRPDSWYRSLPRVGGTKNVDPGRIAALQPDLIIANKEENDRLQVEYLAARYPVWVSDIHNLAEALGMIRAVGELVGKAGRAQQLATTIRQGFDNLPVASPLRTAYLIWRTPDPVSYMAAGGDTFIHDMLSRCGLINRFATRPRYPAVTPGELADCDLILLSSEPYPFRSKHATELESLVPRASIRLVDGEMFSWYGSRLLQASPYFRDLLGGLR